MRNLLICFISLTIQFCIFTETKAQTFQVTNQGQHPYKHIPRDLNSGTDAMADEECVTYESSTGLFEWQTCGSGGFENPATADLDMNQFDITDADDIAANTLTLVPNTYPGIIFNTLTAGDTDYWLAVCDDAGGDDDDIIQLGDGTSRCTNRHWSVNTNGRMDMGSGTGVGLSAASGTLTIAGVGNTNNEDLTVNLETTANVVRLGTTTGVTGLRIDHNLGLGGASPGSASPVVNLVSSASASGGRTGMVISQTNTSTVATAPAAGIDSTAIKSGTTGGNAGTLKGVSGTAQYSSTGVQADAYGVYGIAQKITSASGSITDAYSLYGDAPSASGGGTITRPYALGLAGAMKLIGSADMPQVRIVGNGTQTNNILDVQQSDGTSNFFVTNTGVTARTTFDFETTTGTDVMTGATGGIKISAPLQVTSQFTLPNQPCNSFSNGGVLTVNSAGAVVCQDDDSGAGGGYYQYSLMPQGAVLDDNSPPALSVSESAGAGTSRKYFLSFDATTDEIVYWSFVVPSDMAAGDWLLDVYWITNDVGATETACWGAALSATTEGDADSLGEDAVDTINYACEDVNTTEANRLIQTTITMSSIDSVAGNDFVTLALRRDADSTGGTDDLTSDATGITARIRIPK